MKIAYIIQDIAGNGGMERIVTRKANYLAGKLGYEVSIITASQDGRPCRFPLHDTINLIDLHCRYNPNTPKIFYKEWETALSDYLKSDRHDIVISTGGADLGFVHRIKDGSIKIAEYHFAYDTNNYWANNLYSRRYGKTVARVIGWLKTRRTIRNVAKYTRFVVLSSTDREKWDRHIDNCIHIYNSIDIGTTDQPYNVTSKRVITVGRHDTQKGYDYMIEAWAKVHARHPEWRLSIYGGGDPTETRGYISEHGLESNVDIAGFSTDIESEYLKSSFFILTSRAEGFGLVIAEAQACGLPVVTFDTPTGPSEIVNDNVDGLVVDRVGNIEGIADKIIHLIANPEKRRKMSTAARVNATRFNQDAIMSRWDTLFKGLVSNRK
ncbi:MAG: glycosyltransferase family 4 protein [Pseudoflavonifractor sp.]|nr:glycosyltransferase family 4 protein [Pseudoflavonifractor sp.]